MTVDHIITTMRAVATLKDAQTPEKPNISEVMAAATVSTPPVSDARLAAVIDAWPRLNEPMKDRLAAMAQAQSAPPVQIN